MSLVDMLQGIRQQSIDTFLSCGGDKRALPQLGFEAAPFIRDSALLTHPLFTVCIANSRGTGSSAIENSVSKLFGQRLYSDPLPVSTPTTYAARQNKYGVSCVQFDHQGALFAVGGSNGVVRIYDIDEYLVRSQLR